MSSPPALSLAGVTRRFGSKLAVDHVDLEVADGEIVALVGPSGCGKSTLVRLVAGIDRADEGRIAVRGTVVDDTASDTFAEPEHRRVGLVFQEHALFPHLTARRNVEFGIRRMAQREARVDEMLALVALGDHGDWYPHELSGGERQRVALARALAPAPGVLLLDEPFASLDPNLRAQLREELRAILRAAGTAVVFITHDQREALAVGDRVAVMRSGRILQCDTAPDVFRRPADSFVAAFMGDADELTPDDAAWLSPGTASNDGRIVMIRPDDLRIDDAAGDAGRAIVQAVEYRGIDWYCTIALPGGSQVRAVYRGEHPPDRGAQVSVRVRAGHRPIITHRTA